jgi:hypothetical protein
MSAHRILGLEQVWTFLRIFPLTSPIMATDKLGVSRIGGWEITVSLGAYAVTLVGVYFFGSKVSRVTF